MILMILLYILVGFFAGFIGSLLAVGAGVILVPFLTLIGFSPAQAVGTSLVAVFMSSFSSTWQIWKTKNNIPWKIAITIGVPGFIMALLGVQLYVMLPPPVMVFIYAAVMFICLDLVTAAEIERPIRMQSERRIKKYFVQYNIIGIVAGLLASLLGIGGGIIIYPMLVRMAKHEVKEAVKISIIVMVFTSFAGTVGHAMVGNVLLFVGIYLGIGAIVGSFMSTIAIEYVSERTINKWIKICLLDLGIVMLYKAFFV